MFGDFQAFANFSGFSLFHSFVFANLMETDGHLTKYLDCMIFEQYTIAIELVSIISMDKFCISSR